MAELFTKMVGTTAFACYSERGIVSYFMFRVLPTEHVGFLRCIQDGAGHHPFAELERIDSLTIFSELSFGSTYGFGNPDGAVYFEWNGMRYMLFYEAKLNETYLESCKGNSYNSTIQGQLELRWRLLTLYKEGPLREDRGVQYVEETEEYARIYREKDRFYGPGAEAEDPAPTAYRRLVLRGGVKDIFDRYVSRCDLDHVYFLCSTRDRANPLTSDNFPTDKRPRCLNKPWDDVKRRFCWISNTVIENCPPL